MGLGENPTREAKEASVKEMAAKVAQNPSGFLMYHPAGTRTLSLGKLLATEFAVELAECLLAVFLLSLTRLNGFAARVGFVTVVGLIAAIATNISYWNWYGFPGSYTAAYIVTQLVGFFVAGVLAALALRRAQFSRV